MALLDAARGRTLIEVDEPIQCIELALVHTLQL
jgi:hypothetical protein